MVSLTGAQVPLTGAQYDLSAGDFTATITELGAGLRRLEHRGQPIIAGYEPDMLPPGGAGQLLCPWPNRVDGGHYAIDGADYQLDLSEPANENAIHGLTRWSSWVPGPGSAAEDEITLRHVLLGHQGYPFCLELDASYRLDADRGLEVSISARNVGSAAAPYGTGQHPYLTAGAATVDEYELELPAGLWQPIGERGIPYDTPEDVTGTEFDFRAAKRIGVTQLDSALTGLTRDADGRVRARLSGARTQVTLWAGPGYEWLQVFTGDTLDASHRRKAVAIEPMTCPPNAFVSGVDLLMLEPGDSVTHTWGIEVTPT
jgi:aldose 1-epimerase